MSRFIPNSFQVPNAVIDELMAELSGAELKIYLFVLRKTKGGIRKPMPFRFLNLWKPVIYPIAK